MSDVPTFVGVHLPVGDLRAAAAFYRFVGLPLPADDDLGEHAEVDLGGGAHLALSVERIVRMYDANWRTPAWPPASALQFQLPSSEAVDAMFERLTGAGYDGHLAPIDAFWGGRYAKVDDPDGNIVGFHGPREQVNRRA